MVHAQQGKIHYLYNFVLDCNATNDKTASDFIVYIL